MAAETVGLGRRGQKDLLVFARDSAGDVDSPYGVVALGVAQLIERDGEFGGPTGFVARGAALPDGVPGLVVATALVGEQNIPHGAQRVGAEEETAASIVVSVEDDLDAVVLLELVVAAHPVGDDSLGLGVETAEAEIEESVVVEDPHFGPLTGGSAFDRFPLEERFTGESLLPGRIVEVPVDFWGLGSAARLNRRRRLG